MNIQWYPGHMTKTRRQMENDVKLVDLVAEVVDARIPISSRNPDIDAMVGDRPRLIIFNRADQADPAITERWVAWFRQRRCDVLETDAKSGRGVGQFSSAAKQVLKDKLEAWKAKGQWWWGCPTWESLPLSIKWQSANLPRPATGQA